jgi:hypothetical protein
MKPLLQLNLLSESEKAQAASLPRAESEAECEEPKPFVPSKRLSRFVNRAAHKAATEYSRSGSGFFSK